MAKNTDLKIFEDNEFGSVRTMMIDDEPWFIGRDIADALGYQNGSRDINRHVDEEDKRKEMIPHYQNGTLVSQMLLINESGMYSLIFSSNLPTAKKFKHWVTSEVLPTLRKTGTYSMTEESTDIQELSRQVSELKEMVQSIKNSQNRNEEVQPPATLMPKKITANESWYEKNKKRVNKACVLYGVTHSCIYHNILSKCSEEYDLEKANEIYRNEVGHYPMYQMDLVSYFPQLADIADKYMCSVG